MKLDRRVWIAQLICPSRHCIAAVAGEAPSEEEASALLRAELDTAMAMLLRTGSMNPWCGLCGAANDTWRVEVGRTQWETMKEAMPHIRDEEAKQAVVRAVFGDLHRHQRPN